MKRLFLIAGTLLATACSSPPAQTAEVGLPADHPQVSAPSQGGISPVAMLGGEVLETLDSGGYSYVRIAMQGGEMWAAGPQSVLEVGQYVSLTGVSLMKNFTSNSLERTFDEIYFVGGFELGGAQAQGPAAEGSSGQVIEVVVGGGYTYVHVQVGDDTLWIAGQGSGVEKGDRVAWSEPLSMGDFHSPTLDRTFDNMFFVSGMWVTQ